MRCSGVDCFSRDIETKDGKAARYHADYIEARNIATRLSARHRGFPLSYILPFHRYYCCAVILTKGRSYRYTERYAQNMTFLIKSLMKAISESPSIALFRIDAISTSCHDMTARVDAPFLVSGDRDVAACYRFVDAPHHRH